MAETSLPSRESIRPDGNGVETDIKTEVDVPVKPERQECCVCTSPSEQCCDMFERRSLTSGTALHALLVRFAGVDPVAKRGATSHLCTQCADLLDVLERTEIEYIRLKRDFELIISKNPLFLRDGNLDNSINKEVGIGAVKNERFDDDYPVSCDSPPILHDDSEDEPLAITKKKRHKPFSRKKSNVNSFKAGNKKKKYRYEQWECMECGATGDRGARGLEAHITLAHPGQVKSEDESILPDASFSNGYPLDSYKVMKLELESSENLLSQIVGRKRRGRPPKHLSLPLDQPTDSKIRRATDNRPPKTLHPCDQCDSKFSSIGRLDHHKLKHSGSKPPYICEVCGAHYKHRRACDIHIQMHKGISDWKCELCNKLFPSKGALHRHNNIHTGKTNYQCDQCGKSFIHTSSFKMHKLAHSGVKPHKCAVCGLALMTSSHLKRHLRIHSGEKRYECPVCGKRFSERYNLAAHEKSHSAELSPAQEQERAAAMRRAIFRCHFCAERFERRYMLERHSTQAHGRTLERPPPRPRNTMSKLLKAQAQAKQHKPEPGDADMKRDVESRRESVDSATVALKHSPPGSGGDSAPNPGAWSSFPVEYARLADYPH